MSKDFRFIHCQPKKWLGRYGRIPGNRSVFHLRHVEGRLWPVIEWHKDGDVGTCVAVDTPETHKLVKAVAEAKRFLGGGDAGTFLVNEFGQVLVPSSEGDGRRALAGTVEGNLLFVDPFVDGKFVDLSDDSKHKCGDQWGLPYVGCQYNLSFRSEIYYFRISSDGGKTEKPPVQDKKLIESLRRIRRTGAVRFIVNHCGLVLTRRPEPEVWNSEEEWHPVYVGRINPKVWFKKEE